MPTLTLASALFSAVFSVAFAAGVVWLLEKKADHARKEVAPLAFTFMAGSFTFTALYFLNRVFFPRSPWVAALVNMSLLAGLFVYPELKKRLKHLKAPRQAGGHHRLPVKKIYRLEGEIAALRAMLERDPLNAFCHERLSEIYEEERDFVQALEEARVAVRMDPSVRNKLRVEDLQNSWRANKAPLKKWRTH